MKIKLLLVALLIIFSISSFSQPAPLPAASIVNAAVKRAADGKKNVLLVFHASWCGWCKKMDASLSDPSCKEFFDKNYVIDHLVVLESKDKTALENPAGMDYLKKWGGETSGLPYWVVLDEKGELIADSRRPSGDGKLENVGCPASEPEVAYFIEVLKKSSKLNAQQQEAIVKRFRQNETQ